jgi:two-component system, OmpR family, response regulator CpxR
MEALRDKDAAARGTSGRGEGRPPTVLVVDDDCGLRDVLREVLEPAGYDVVCACNGREALDYLRSHPPPALVLLDLMMPVMNGWEVLARLEADWELCGVRVLVLTATGPHWGHPVPQQQVVPKPFDVDELLSLVERWARPRSDVSA